MRRENHEASTALWHSGRNSKNSQDMLSFLLRGPHDRRGFHCCGVQLAECCGVPNATYEIAPSEARAGKNPSRPSYLHTGPSSIPITGCALGIVPADQDKL